MMQPQSIFGLKVHIEPLCPRYTLPDDVPPPTGMTREEFASWSRAWCGYQKPMLVLGQMIQTPAGIHMSLPTWERVKQATRAQHPTGGET